METNLPCAVVRDLLPSYAEGLTEPETTEAVKAHLDGCGNCAARYAAMTGEVPPVTLPPDREVDFLKTIRKKNQRRVLLAVVLVLVLVLGGTAAKLFLIGSPVGGESVVTQAVQEGDSIKLQFSCLDSASTLSHLETQTQGDVLIITGRKTLVSPVHPARGHLLSVSTAGLREIRAFGQTIWQENLFMDHFTNRLLKAATPYVGNASAMGQLISAMDLDVPCTLELQTAQQPYGVTLRFTQPIEDHRHFLVEGAAHLLLALVGNLEEIHWSWPVADGQKRQSGHLTLEDANANLPLLVQQYNQTHGTDWLPLGSVKDYGADAYSLQQLREILGV